MVADALTEAKGDDAGLVCASEGKVRQAKTKTVAVASFGN